MQSRGGDHDQHHAEYPPLARRRGVGRVWLPELRSRWRLGRNDGATEAPADWMHPMHAGSIMFVEIPVRDLGRAADFYAGLFGWSFEHEDDADGWFFTSGGRGPMGRITIGRPAGHDGVRVTVAVNDIAATTRRAI